MEEEIYKKAYLSLPSDINPIKIVSRFLYHCWMREVLKENPKILSQGCEIGTWEKELRKEFSYYWEKAEVTGVDINRSFLRKAKKVIPVLASDVRFLSFIPDYFDISYSPMVLQWLSQKERIKNIKETARVLKKRGKALFIVPGPFHLQLELSHLQQFSDIGEKEFKEKKSEFFPTKRGLMEYALKDFSVVEGWEVKGEFTPSSEQRLSLVYADTLAPTISHNKDSYCHFLARLTQPTTIHWVIVGCTKVVQYKMKEVKTLFFSFSIFQK